jgi:hypothetical protein
MGRSKKQLKATEASHSTRNRWLAAVGLLLVIGLVAAVLLIDWSSNTAPNPSEAERLVGRWERQDGGYVLEIRHVAADGQAEASYFNPNPIHVAQAGVKQEGASVGIFIELQDVGYPGSTYTLTYDAQRDELQGTYFQAATQQQFDVTFVREK